MMDAQTISDIKKKADTAFQRNFQYYQETGNSRYEREYRKNEDIADICRLALEHLNEADVAKMRRKHNIMGYATRINDLYDDTVPKKEVLKILDEISLL